MDSNSRPRPRRRDHKDFTRTGYEQSEVDEVQIGGSPLQQLGLYVVPERNKRGHAQTQTQTQTHAPIRTDSPRMEPSHCACNLNKWS